MAAAIMMYSDAIIVKYAITMCNVYLFITKRYIKTLEAILVFCGESDPQSIEL